VAERYGARVTVTAAPGGGARFALHFQPALGHRPIKGIPKARAG